MVLKMDLEKANARLDQSFIEDTKRDASSPGKLTDVIMKMIGNNSRRLLWNDETTDMIKLARGLRQGDP